MKRIPLAVALMVGTSWAQQDPGIQIAIAEKYEKAGDYEAALAAYVKAGDLYGETGYAEVGATKLMDFAGRMEHAGRYEIAASAYAEAGDLYGLVGKGSYGIKFLLEFAGRAENARKYEAVAVAYEKIADLYTQLGYPNNEYYEKAAEMRIKAKEGK